MTINATVIGNLQDRPEIKFADSGDSYCHLSIVSVARKFDKTTNKWVDGDKTYVSATCWRQLAENVAESFDRGDQIMAWGDLTVRKYTGKDGQEREQLKLNVKEVGVSLRFHAAQTRRAVRTNGPSEDFLTEAAPF